MGTEEKVWLIWLDIEGDMQSQVSSPAKNLSAEQTYWINLETRFRYLF